MTTSCSPPRTTLFRASCTAVVDAVDVVTAALEEVVVAAVVVCDGGGERRGFSDGRTFLHHVASVSSLSPSPVLARGFPRFRYPARCPFSSGRDARAATIGRGRVNATSQSFDDGSPEATSSGKEASLFSFAENPFNPLDARNFAVLSGGAKGSRNHFGSRIITTEK